MSDYNKPFRIPVLMFLFIYPLFMLFLSCQTDSSSKIFVEKTVTVTDTLMGDWLGKLISQTGAEINVVGQIIAYENGKYTANILRQFNNREPAIIILQGKLIDGKIHFSGNSSDGAEWQGVAEGKFFKGTVKGLENFSFILQKALRLSPTLGQKPPEDSGVILFDGKNLDNWQREPEPVGYINLAKLIGKNDCVVYLRSSVWSEINQQAILLLGSDDGVKVWLNKQLIHQKNAERGAAPAQDTVNIRLGKGWNPIMLKINNGGGGWGAFAQLVDKQKTPLLNIAEQNFAAADKPPIKTGLAQNKQFLTSWQGSPLYTQAGKEGKQLFDVVFEPEQNEDKVAWKIYEAPKIDKSAVWRIVDGAMEVNPGSGSIYTKQSFKDFQLHIEFRSPFLPNLTGQKRGNSGVYLQGRYEVQVLDSYGLDGKDNECGGIYKVAQPKVNMCAPPGQWQTYDITCRSAKFDQTGKKTSNARITVLHNGVPIHENLNLPGPTAGGLDADETKPGPLFLQDHGDLVQFRNIWLVEIN